MVVVAAVAAVADDDDNNRSNGQNAATATTTWSAVPILCINLDRRPDRLAAVAAELARLGRGPLAEAAAAPAPPEEEEGEAAPPTLRLSATDLPADGALGCTRSHIRGLELALARQWPAVAVLEDDFACTDPARFRRSVDAFFAARRPWDVLMLGANLVREGSSSPATTGGGGDGVHRVHAAFSSVGYVVSGSYLPTLLANMRSAALLLSVRPRLRYRFALDVYWHSLQARDAWFVCRPRTVTQAVGFSDIEGTHTDYFDLMLDGDNDGGDDATRPR